MNKRFVIILYVDEGSEELFTFCMVSILRKNFRTEWFKKFVFNFNLTGVYLLFCSLCSAHVCLGKILPDIVVVNEIMLQYTKEKLFSYRKYSPRKLESRTSLPFYWF